MPLARHSDDGETLIEVLVSIVILGLAGVAVTAALGFSVKASDIHRKDTTSGAYVKSLAEAIQNYVSTPGATNYIACAGQNAYLVPAVTGAVNLPTGYAPTQLAAVGVGPTGATTASCSGATPVDTGIQQLTLRVTSADGRGTETLSLVIRKPCDPTVAQCTS